MGNTSQVLNYETHPLFHNAIKSLSLKDEIIAEFDQVYRQSIITLDQTNSKDYDKTLIKLHLTLGELLKNIFTLLKSQSSDFYNLTFLNELESQCLRLLPEQLEYHPVDRNSSNVNTSLFSNKKFIITHLPDLVIQKILTVASTQLEKLKQNAENGLLTREALSINTGKEIKAITKILNRAFKKDKSLSLISEYMGKPYEVSGLALELSDSKSTWWKHQAQNVTAPKTIYAHVDETSKNPKAIVYLSKVEPENGPTSCYPGVYESLSLNALQNIIGRVISQVATSPNIALQNYYDFKYHQPMTCPKFREHFMLLPKSLRFNSHLGWDLVADSDLEKKFLEKEEKILGNPGTTLIFDGAALFHRGGLIEANQRLVLQVIFSPRKSFTEKVLNKIKSLLLKSTK